MAVVVHYTANPFGLARNRVTVEKNATYDEVIAACGLSNAPRDLIRVCCGDRLLRPEEWQEQIGDAPITVRLVAGKDSQEWWMYFVSTISLAGYAYYLSKGGNPLYFSMPLKFSRRVKKRVAAEDSPTLNGVGNQVAPYSRVPNRYGRQKITPEYAALSYRRVIGDDQVFFGVFCLGYGPFDFDYDLARIGDTKFSDFPSASMQVDHGDGVIYDVTNVNGLWTETESTEAFEVFSLDVNELAVGSHYAIPDKGDRGPTGWTEPQPWDEAPLRTSEDGVRLIEIDFFFPAGVETIDRKGYRHKLKLSYDLRLRRTAQPGIDHGAGTGEPGPWVFPESLGNGGESFSYETGATEADGVRFAWNERHEGSLHRSFQIRASDTVGQWDVQIRKAATSRLGAGAQPETMLGESIWDILRSIKPSDPVRMEGIALIAVQIKASDQASGTLEDFNIVANRRVQKNTGGAWEPAIYTSNPAWIYADLLRGAASKRPSDDAHIDVARIREFATYCDDNGFEFNGSIDYETTDLEAIESVLLAARASYLNRDGRDSVIWDAPQDLVAQLLTPRNTQGTSIAYEYKRQPHALRVKFPNRDKDWEIDERVVYADGYDIDNATLFEEVDLFGVTDADHAWKLADYQMRIARLRTARIEVDLDWEALNCERGDLVDLSNDVLLGDVEWGLVTSVTADGSQNVTSFTIDALVTYLPGVDYGCTIRQVTTDGSASSEPYTVKNPTLGEAVESDTIAPTEPIDAIYVGGVAEAAVHVGDLVAFGEAGVEVIRCIVQGVRPSGNLGATLLLTQYAPEVFNLGAPLPEWTSGIRTSRYARPPQPVLGVSVAFSAGIRVTVYVPPPVIGQVEARALQAQIRQTGSTGGWQSIADLPANASQIVFVGLEPGAAYDIRARTASGKGTFSEWASSTASFDGDALTVDLFKVSGLQLVAGSSPTVFGGRTAHFAWRMAYVDPSYDPSAAAGAPLPGVTGNVDFVVRILDAQTLEVVREESVRGMAYEYSLAKQYEDPGPLRREFTIQVAFKDSLGSVGAFQSLTVENEAPPLLSATPTVIRGGLRLHFFTPSDADFEGVVVWSAASPGFALDASTEVYRGNASPAFIPSANDAYYRWAAYDQFAVDPATGAIDPTLLNVSAEQFIEGKGGLVDTPDIAQGAVTDLDSARVTINARLTTATIWGVPVGRPGVELFAQSVDAEGVAGSKVLFQLYFEHAPMETSRYTLRVECKRDDGVVIDWAYASGSASSSADFERLSPASVAFLDKTPKLDGAHLYRMSIIELDDGNDHFPLIGDATLITQVIKR